MADDFLDVFDLVPTDELMEMLVKRFEAKDVSICIVYGTDNQESFMIYSNLDDEQYVDVAELLIEESSYGETDLEIDSEV